MKKHLLLILIACSAILVANAQSHPQLSTKTRYFLHEITKNKSAQFLPEGYAYRQLADGKIYTTALISVNNAGLAAEQFAQLGIKTGTKAGNVWTVQVPLDQITAFTRVSGVDYIQLDEPAFPAMQEARKTTRTDSVHKGYGLPMPYSGKDVLMGVIDFGFDYNHPGFYDTTGSRYRVRKVWELNTTGTPPAGYSYGHELTDTNTIKAQGTDNGEQMHGTGVAGIAAGSGFGSTPQPNRFRGIAYESDMIFVGVRRDTIGDQWMQGSFADFVDGVNYIMTEADAQSKPVVVNISWGSQSGPHDGTTLFNQACDNLSGPGKIIVMSAGNEGEEKIHISKTFTATDTGVHTFLSFTSEDYKRTWVDIWGEPGKSFCAQVTLYSNGIAGATTDIICIDNNLHQYDLTGANGLDTCHVEFITDSSVFINNKPRLTLNIHNKASDSVGITVTGTDGTIHMWDEYYFYGYKYGFQSAFWNMGQPWATNGNTASTVSDMGAAASVLLIGAYASKTVFTDINGYTWSYNSYVSPGSLVPFSSRGPMVDGRIKPDIAGPGLTLCTATSSYDTAYGSTGSKSDRTITSYSHLGKTYYYAEFTGTSASAPAASGIVALLLEANPSLTPQEVREAIVTTAIKDSRTGNIPPAGNNNWGHGKINAYGAIKKVLQQLSTYEFSGAKAECVLFPNPNNGSFTLDYTGVKTEDITIEVINLAGRRVVSDVWRIQEGLNRRQLNLNHLPGGNYIVRLQARKGSVAIKTVIH